MILTAAAALPMLLKVIALARLVSFVNVVKPELFCRSSVAPPVAVILTVSIDVMVGAKVPAPSVAVRLSAPPPPASTSEVFNEPAFAIPSNVSTPRPPAKSLMPAVSVNDLAA